ncbi:MULTISPECIES: LysR substrate-binding domain-containing protein [Methylomonas]|uniref:LysR substrate-binding domain-containing protein n=1 Tax=Methylomonas TaxID=416 RepID=UPI0012319B66|nr:LysR substrate-binding domain-containing protein [Methylomonas rhizoryzae]
MNLSQLELLRTLQETGFNLSKAAERMHVVQSAVSRQLQMLESELGSPLFERHGKRLLGLTPLGERIMCEVERIHQAKKNIQTMADDFRDNRSGTLHVATTHAQAKYLLPNPVQNFRVRYPSVKIYMVQSSPGELIDLLHQHRADIAICTEKLAEDERLVIRPCYEWHHVAIVPKNHVLLQTPIELTHLAAFPILTYCPGFTGRGAIDKSFSDAGLQPDIILAAADSDVIKTYVRLGLGVGIIAETSYEAERDEDLVALSLKHLIPPSVTKIAYLQQLYLPSYCRFFIDALLQQARIRKQ